MRKIGISERREGRAFQNKTQSFYDSCCSNCVCQIVVTSYASQKVLKDSLSKISVDYSRPAILQTIRDISDHFGVYDSNHPEIIGVKTGVHSGTFSGGHFDSFQAFSLTCCGSPQHQTP